MEHRSHTAQELIQQYIFPLLWVWSVEMEIIDYKLNESDISLHNYCYSAPHEETRIVIF